MENGRTIHRIAAAPLTAIEELPTNLAAGLVSNLLAAPEIVRAERVPEALAEDRELLVETGPAVERAQEILAAPAIVRAVEPVQEILLVPIDPAVARVRQLDLPAAAHLAAAEVRLVVVAEIASAIAAFHPAADLDPVAVRLAVADLVEARLDPLVRAEAAAWAAVDLAAEEDAAAEGSEEEEVAAAADEVVAAVVVVKQSMHEEKPMKSKLHMMTSTKILLFGSAIICVAGLSLIAATETKKDSPTASQQKQFNTPKEAADSLIAAASSFDVAQLKEILGPDAGDVVSSADPVADKNRATAFAEKAKAKMNVGTDPKNPNQVIVTVGDDDFPLAIPIVKRGSKWMFDTKIGRQEILNRRIGSNELDAIAICHGFDDAQQQYAQEKHDDAKVNQYAQKIVSTPGKHDGLAWQNADGTWGGPVGQGIANALEQGYTQKSQPYHGYYFKVLKGQGPAAPMGQMDFVVDGAMIGGFALAAAPAQYRITGVKTFIVGPNGIVYEKDLGQNTLKTFQAMERYNPDKTWHETDDDWPESDDAASAGTNK